jgi:DNA modification methylase
MKPYYEHAGITIYHADCRDVLPHMTADVLVTDPPYGVALNTKYCSARRGVLAGANDYPPIFGDAEPFDPNHLLGAKAMVLWGANYYADKLPARGSWLIWDKRDGSGFNDQADAELAWVTGVSGTVPRLFTHRWNGMIKASERDKRRRHPTQKPVALMVWCISFFPQAGSVLDPYAGSGTTLVAAKNLGRRAIGIEIEERYCEIAAKRLSQEVLPLGTTAERGRL